MKPPSVSRETGWLPDCVFTGERFESGIAFFADEQGRITRFSRDTEDHRRARRLEGQAALPGLVLAHSQCLRRLARGNPSVGNVDQLEPADVYAVARMAFLELVLSGVTCVGESGILPRLSVEQAQAILRAAADVGLRMAYFHGGAAAHPWIEELDALRQHLAQEHLGDLAWLGIQVADATSLSLDQLKEIGTYGHVQRFRLQYQTASVEGGASSLLLLGQQGLLDKRATAIIGGVPGADAVQQLSAGRAMACICPLSNHAAMPDRAALDHLKAAGVDVALGLDDHARSNGLEVVRKLPPSIPAVERLRMATAAGARSLGAPSGALEVGRPADFFTLNLYEPSLAGASLDGLLQAALDAAERRAVREVWIAARPRVSHGRHVQQGPIISRFVELQQRWRR